MKYKISIINLETIMSLWGFKFSLISGNVSFYSIRLHANSRLKMRKEEGRYRRMKYNWCIVENKVQDGFFQLLFCNNWKHCNKSNNCYNYLNYILTQIHLHFGSRPSHQGHGSCYDWNVHWREEKSCHSRKARIRRRWKGTVRSCSLAMQFTLFLF